MNYLADNLMLTMENPSTDKLKPQMWCEHTLQIPSQNMNQKNATFSLPLTPCFFRNVCIERQFMEKTATAWKTLTLLRFIPTTSSQLENQQSVIKKLVVFQQVFLSDYNTNEQDLNNEKKMKSYDWYF